MGLRFLTLLALVLATGLAAQSLPPASMDATALVRRALQNRLDAEKNHRPVRYLIRRTDNRHTQPRRSSRLWTGDVARLVAINGKLSRGGRPTAPGFTVWTCLANHPEMQEHRHKSEQKDAERISPPAGPAAGRVPVPV